MNPTATERSLSTVGVVCIALAYAVLVVLALGLMAGTASSAEPEKAPMPKEKAEPKKVTCICGPSCNCAVGDCPSKCQVADAEFAPPGYPQPPKGFHWIADVRGGGGWGLLQNGVSRPEASKLPPVRVGEKAVYRQFCSPGGCVRVRVQ